MSAHAILTTASDRPGMLSGLTKVLADHEANITYVDIHTGVADLGHLLRVHAATEAPLEPVLRGSAPACPASSGVEETPSFSKIYGKRIIVMGGGAQVGLVAMGAISEADRHNIRGERISDRHHPARRRAGTGGRRARGRRGCRA